MSSSWLAYLEVEINGIVNNENASLWTREGLSDVRVEYGGWNFLIPENVLWDLFAEEFRRRQISKLEQMDTEDVRVLIGVSDVKGK